MWKSHHLKRVWGIFFINHVIFWCQLVPHASFTNEKWCHFVCQMHLLQDYISADTEFFQHIIIHCCEAAAGICQSHSEKSSFIDSFHTFSDIVSSHAANHEYRFSLPWNQDKCGAARFITIADQGHIHEPLETWPHDHRKARVCGLVRNK